MFGDSLEEEPSSYWSLDALIINVDKGINNNEVYMPHSILSEEEVRANFQRKELAKDFTQVRLSIEGCEPSTAKVLGCLTF